MYPRPHWSVLNESIPMFVIGRNRDGHWVVCDSQDRTLGAFPDQASAVALAKQESAPGGCALMFVTECLEPNFAVVPAGTAAPATS
jgi:hypothetical protein